MKVWVFLGSLCSKKNKAANSHTHLLHSSAGKSSSLSSCKETWISSSLLWTPGVLRVEGKDTTTLPSCQSQCCDLQFHLGNLQRKFCCLTIGLVIILFILLMSKWILFMSVPSPLPRTVTIHTYWKIRTHISMERKKIACCWHLLIILATSW